MRKYTLYVGLNDKDTKTQKVDTLEAYKIVSNLLVATVGGGTIYQAQGIYKHNNGNIVIENTLRIEIIEASENDVNYIIKTLKTILNQESIILQTENIESKLI
jgi:hypothetical protein